MAYSDRLIEKTVTLRVENPRVNGIHRLHLPDWNLCPRFDAASAFLELTLFIYMACLSHSVGRFLQLGLDGVSQSRQGPAAPARFSRVVRDNHSKPGDFA